MTVRPVDLAGVVMCHGGDEGSVVGSLVRFWGLVLAWDLLGVVPELSGFAQRHDSVITIPLLVC